MSKEKSNQKIKRRRWTFFLEAAEAKEVLLIGDFNNWSPGKHPMQKDKNGMWNKTVMLFPGNHEYKFLVDGQWREDPLNNRLCPNCFGTYNNMINLPEA
jgi:1,4-alpha-glucan branching enzyme